MRKLAAIYLVLFAALFTSWQCLATSVTLTGAGVQSAGGGGTGTAPSLDTNCSGACLGTTNVATNISNSTALVTSGVNRLIVVHLVSANNTGTGSAPTGAAPTFSTVVGLNSLTYNLHKRYSFTGTSGRCNTGGAGCFVNVEVWYAIATAQITATPEVITATTTASAGSLTLTASAYFRSGSVSWGATPFDPNASLGNHVEGNDSVFASQTGKSITNNGTLGLMFGVNVTNAGPGPLAPNGSWVSAVNALNQVSTNPFVDINLLNQPFTTSQSGTFGYTATVGGGGSAPFGDWSVMLDALSS